MSDDRDVRGERGHSAEASTSLSAGTDLPRKDTACREGEEEGRAWSPTVFFAAAAAAGRVCGFVLGGEGGGGGWLGAGTTLAWRSSAYRPCCEFLEFIEWVEILGFIVMVCWALREGKEAV